MQRYWLKDYSFGLFTMSFGIFTGVGVQLMHFSDVISLARIYHGVRDWAHEVRVVSLPGRVHFKWIAYRAHGKRWL